MGGSVLVHGDTGTGVDAVKNRPLRVDALGAVKVAQFPELVRASWTRPANTTAYAAGDAMMDSTSAPTVGSLTVARANGYGGVITQGMLLSRSQAATAQDIDVFLFTETVTAPNDNAAFAPSAAELLTLVGVIHFDADDALPAGSGGQVWQAEVVRAFKCAAGDTKLYFVPVVRGAYAPASAELFTLVLGVKQD